MLIMINADNKMNMKRDNVRIIRIILDLHGAIVDSRKVAQLKILFFIFFLFYSPRHTFIESNSE